MRDFQKRGKLRRLLESKLVLAVLAGVLLFSMWNLAVFWRKMSETGRNKEIAGERVKELEANKESLEYEIERLQSDRGIEEVLREDYGLSREGEGVIIVVEDQNALKAQVPKDTGFWAWVKGIFD